jgi:hypothetical protein
MALTNIGRDPMTANPRYTTFVPTINFPRKILSPARLARLERLASRDRIIAKNLAALRRALGLEA